MTIKIVDLPIKNGDVPSFFVGLPEGNRRFFNPRLASVQADPTQR
jgi:hypothetical protein